MSEGLVCDAVRTPIGCYDGAPFVMAKATSAFSRNAEIYDMTVGRRFPNKRLHAAFAAQGLAVMRELGLPGDAPHVNAQGGAIAVGHPLGMSGARLVLTDTRQLHRTGAATRSAPCAWAWSRGTR